MAGILQQMMGGGSQGGARDNPDQNFGPRHPTTRGMIAREKTLTLADFFTSDQSNLNSGEDNLLGTHTVGAKTIEEVGQGWSGLDPREQGAVNIDLKNTSSTDQEGDVKIRHEDPFGDSGVTIIEERTEDLRQSDRTKRVVLPRAYAWANHPPVTEDSRIAIYFDPDSDGITVGNDESTIQLPITRYRRS